MPMNPKIKQEWIAALRSGEYKQGQKTLSSDGKHCCLGVLCELAVKQGVLTKEFSGGTTWFRSTTNDRDASYQLLPQAVVRWAGLDCGATYEPDCRSANVLVIQENYSSRHLTDLNDNDCYTFQKIADLIAADSEI